jgi:hypothetical protein
MTVEFLVSIKSQVTTDAQNILHPKQCTSDRGLSLFFEDPWAVPKGSTGIKSALV